jgi:acetoin utilization protein AcuB
MRIQDVMTDEIFSISPQESVLAARQMLRLHDIRHLVVLEGKEIVGVLSDRDLASQADDVRVADVMTRGVATISPRATLRQAAGKMEGRTIGCLPVMDRGKLAGIVTTSDLLRALATGTHPAPSPARYVLRKGTPRKRQQFR